MIVVVKPHHSTTQMQPTVTDTLAWSVCRSVTIVSPAKTAEAVAMPFGLWTRLWQGTTWGSRYPAEGQF